MDGTTCPHCGEWIDVFVDEGGASCQDFIDDCSVCCRPIRFRIRLERETGQAFIEANAET